MLHKDIHNKVGYNLHGHNVDMGYFQELDICKCFTFKMRLKRLSVLDREIRNFYETFLEVIEPLETI